MKGDVRVREGLADVGEILQQVGQPELFKFRIYDFADNKYHEMKDYNIDV